MSVIREFTPWCFALIHIEGATPKYINNSNSKNIVHVFLVKSIMKWRDYWQKTFRCLVDHLD